MKLQFDANQKFQQDAVQAVVDIFDGQPLQQQGVQVTIQTSSADPLFAGTRQSELGLGNALLPDEATLLKNIHAIQERNDIDPSPSLHSVVGYGKAQASGLAPMGGLHFSVEMETGTGKTYVYLRTIFELNAHYGFKKFIIVVPSVAVREGVLKNIEITAEHFRALYGNIEFEHFVYDARRIPQLRQFAVSNTIQILVINIDAFRKNFTGTDAERKSNVIYKETDRLQGRQPIEFIQATNPIVIIDEPQSVDSTEKAQEAIKALNPLCTLRYSATHRNPYNLVYRLDPIRSLQMGLVKQIVVGSTRTQNAHNTAFVRLDKTDNKKGIKAKVTLHVAQESGIAEKSITVKAGDDLFYKSAERELYRQGYEVVDINCEPGAEYIQFSSGKRLAIGESHGGFGGDIARLQIRKTVEKHLLKELEVRNRAQRGEGVKVLTLFFLDRVANYRTYDTEGASQKGPYALLFEETLAEFLKESRFAPLLPYAAAEKVHNGYFSQDKKGVLKDTSGETQADDDTYNLIMKEKEQLLSLHEPLRFIFSHSALREGWDNPNVFQIGTLASGTSTVKKRQEIGRGLRLPVNEKGQRIFDPQLNKLYVVANESYEAFAKALQDEYEDDCGVTFGKLPKFAFAKLETGTSPEGEAVVLGREAGERLRAELVAKGFLTDEGRLTEKFTPRVAGFTLGLSGEFAEHATTVVSLLQSYQMERHLKRDDEEKRFAAKKEVLLDPEFEALWKKINARTTYRVEYQTDTLVTTAVKAIKGMEKIEQIRVTYHEAAVALENKGVIATMVRESSDKLVFGGAVPDIIAYLQAETELTRSTLVRILKDSGRLAEFFHNPQRFMDAVAVILKRELHRLIIDGIKYERIAGEEYSMQLFEGNDSDLVTYLHNRYELKNKHKSPYDAVAYDSEVERKFAEGLDKREDVKLFVKLPSRFLIQTPIGNYNPDWAIVTQDNRVVYLVRETKSTRDLSKLRPDEATKIRCGERHFEALGVDFDVVTSIDDLRIKP
jgi:type III restriction enzyme